MPSAKYRSNKLGPLLLYEVINGKVLANFDWKRIYNLRGGIGVAGVGVGVCKCDLAFDRITVLKESRYSTVI